MTVWAAALAVPEMLWVKGDVTCTEITVQTSCRFKSYILTDKILIYTSFYSGINDVRLKLIKRSFISY
jgi:hypothetical protein